MTTTRVGVQGPGRGAERARRGAGGGGPGSGCGCGPGRWTAHAGAGGGPRQQGAPRPQTGRMPPSFKGNWRPLAPQGKWGSRGGRPGPAILALHGGGQGAVLVGEVLPPTSAPQTKPLATGPQGRAPQMPAPPPARLESSTPAAPGATPQHRPHPRPGAPRGQLRTPFRGTRRALLGPPSATARERSQPPASVCCPHHRSQKEQTHIRQLPPHERQPVAELRGNGTGHVIKEPQP